MWISNGILYAPCLLLVCARLNEAFSACGIHGLVIDANWWRKAWLRVGQPHPMRQIPVPVACRISPTKHCRVAHTLKHIHHCRWWWFPMYIYFIYPKHDTVKIFVCLDIGIWHPVWVYASCILLHVLFANCTLRTFQLDLSNNENSTYVGSRAWP